MSISHYPNCIFEEGACITCGRKLPAKTEMPVYRNCIGPDGDAKQRARAVGPGTRLKNFLEKHGVTEEWYRGMKEEVGLLPECDCEMRREMLDETWAAYKTGGWKAAKMAYSRVKEHYAKPR